MSSVTVTAEDVADVAPEFAAEDEERVERFIDRARLYVNEAQFGERAALAITFYTAHLLTLSARQGAGGQVTQAKVGDVSMSYGQSSGSSPEPLAQTSYGLMFLELRRSTETGPLIV